MGLSPTFSRGICIRSTCNRRYNSYGFRESIQPVCRYHRVNRYPELRSTGTAGIAQGVHMKLQLIAASVLAYTLLATAWICYADLALP